MKLKEKIPFLEGNGDKSQEEGRVRALAKLGQGNNFTPEDFNELVQASVQRLDNRQEDNRALLDDDLENRPSREDLLERHLSYRVKVGKEKTNSGGKEGVVEGPTFKVIMRVQPSKAIEVNGPSKVTDPYREVLKDTFENQFGDSIQFKNILE